MAQPSFFPEGPVVLPSDDELRTIQKIASQTFTCAGSSTPPAEPRFYPEIYVARVADDENRSVHKIEALSNSCCAGTVIGEPHFYPERSYLFPSDDELRTLHKINAAVNACGNGDPSGSTILPEGDNYKFTYDGDFYTFNIKDMDGNAYAFEIVGTHGIEQIRLTLNPSPVVVGIVPNFAFSQNYQFTPDNYMRIQNDDDNVSWYTVSALLDETLLISDFFASNPAGSTDSNTFNAVFLPPTPSFFFKHIGTGQRFKPWIVLDAGNPMIQLTAI